MFDTTMQAARRLAGALVVLALLGHASAQGAPFESPFLVHAGEPGRPDLAVGEKPSALGDDLDLEPALVVPQLAGSIFTTYTLIIGSSGAPILVLLEPPVGGGGGNQAATGDTGGGGTLDDVVVANDELPGVALTYDAPGPSFAPNPALVFDGGATIDGAKLVDVGDVTNDGTADLVVIQAAPLVGDELLVFAGDGAGGFAAAPTQALPLLPGGQPLTATDSVLADIDADGFLDLVVAFGEPVDSGSTDGYVAFFRNDGQLPGAFVTPDVPVVAAGDPVVSVLVADFEAPGAQLELLITFHVTPTSPDSHRAETLLYRYLPGLNTFQRVVPWGFTEPSPIGIVAKWGDVGDLDGDGDVDAVLTSNDHVMIPDNSHIVPPVFFWSLVNDGDGSFTVIKDTTRFAGRAVDPVLVDVGEFLTSFTDELAATAAAAPPELVLNFSCDANAGTGLPPEWSTHAVALTGVGDGTFEDEVVPEKIAVGASPADGFIVELDVPTPIFGAALDVVVPNTAGRSYSVLKGDGAGGVLSNTEVAIALPGGTTGGPTDAQTAQLDPGAAPDMVIYSPIGFGGVVEPFIDVFHGDGSGGFTPVQTLVVDAGGEMSLGDVDGDGIVDLVVTLRTGSANEVEVHLGEETFVGSGVPTGTFEAFPSTSTSTPAGYDLVGGLALADVDADGKLDAVTACSDDGTTLSLLVVDNDALTGLAAIPLTPLAASSFPKLDVESIVVGTLDAGGDVDIAVGMRTGELAVFLGDGTGGFTEQRQALDVTDTGGGSLALGDVHGDGHVDIVATKGEPADQQVVEVQRGNATAKFVENALCGWSASDDDGGARPLLGDLDDDGTLDLVLVHGQDDSVTFLLNDLNSGVPLGVGYPGKGGITPSLKTYGTTGVGATMKLVAGDLIGESLAVLLVGYGDELPPLAMSQFFDALFVTFETGGSARVAGSGGGEIELKIPKSKPLIGLELRFQVAGVDRDGYPGFGLSLSNGVVVKVLEP